MSDQNLTIKLQLDKSLATSQSKAYHDGERQRIKETADAVKKAEREKAAAAKREAADVAKENAKFQKAMLDMDKDVARARINLEKENAKARRSINAEESRATKEAMREINRSWSDSLRQRTAESRAASKLQQQMARDDAIAEREAIHANTAAHRQAMAEAQKGLKGTSAELRKRIGDENSLKVLLTNQQIAERARVELTQQLNRKKIDGAKDVLVAENRMFRSLKDSSSALKESMGSAGDSVEGLIGKYAGFAGVVAGVMAVGAAWDEVNKAQRAAYTEYMRIQKESRQGAGVKGISAEEYSQQKLKLAAGSGTTLAEADQLTREFEGSLPIGLEKGNITRKVADDLLKETAVSQARLGGDAGTRGELAGLIAQNTKIGSVKQGLGKIEAIRTTLQAGRGSDSDLTRELLQTIGALSGEGGMLANEEETAALVGVTSLAGGSKSAGTRALQVSRALRGTTTKQAQALEREFGIKVDSRMGMEDRLKTIVPKLRKIKGEKNLDAYLRDTLDMPEENAQALKEILPNFEVLQDRLKTVRAIAADEDEQGGSAVMAENAKFLNSAEGQAMKAEAAGEAGKYIQGRKQKEYRAVVGQAQATIDSQDPTFLHGMETWAVNKVGAWVPGAGNQAEERANRIMAEEIERRGIANPLGGVTGTFRGLTMSPVERGQELMGTLRDNDIDPMKLIAEKLDKVVSALDEGNQDRKQGNQDRKNGNREVPQFTPLPQPGMRQPPARAGAGR